MPPEDANPTEPTDPIERIAPIAAHEPLDRGELSLPCDSLPDQRPALPEEPVKAPARGVAPIWHTLLLILGIVAYSTWGAQRSNSDAINPLAPTHHVAAAIARDGHTGKGEENEGADPLRILRYALSAGLELGIVGWVFLGLRLRGVRFRSLFGKWPQGLNAITAEAAFAAVFWLGSMLVLVACALGWNAVQTRVYEHQVKLQEQAESKSGNTKPHGKEPNSGPVKNPTKPKSPEDRQAESIRQLMEIAPADGVEIAAWGLLCLVVGFSEELIFRGYLQLQGIGLLRNVPVTVLLTSLVFGAAHGYQGLRGMCIITVFGALFSCLTLLRRNLFPGMIAHAWHDFATGMLLALVRSAHLLDRLAKPS